MNKFVVIPDITCDLSEEIRDYFSIEEYISGYIHINDKSIRSTLDWSLISREEFYKALSDKKMKVSSATASPEQYYQTFKKYIEQGYDVLSISISSKASATYNVSVLGADRIREEYPHRKIYCLDSARMSGSFGLVVAYACEMRDAGLELDEAVARLEVLKMRVHQMGPIDDLTFVARRGQISNGKAFMGNLVGVKPMGDSNRYGYVSVLGKVKGIKKALDVTVSYIEHVATDIEDQYIFIMHSDREEYAMLLKEKIEARIKAKKVFLSDVFPGCGANIGPGMISAYFLGEPISENNVTEKEMLNLAISENS